MLHLKFLQPTRSTNPCNSYRKTNLGTMLHGISVNGVIERIEGNPEFADAEVVRLRGEGHAAEYLFGARTEGDFCQKEQTERQRLSHRYDDRQEAGKDAL